jgi:hypothetical protein
VLICPEFQPGSTQVPDGIARYAAAFRNALSELGYMAPRETSTERLRAAIDRIRGKTHQDDLPATDQDDPPSTH